MKKFLLTLITVIACLSLVFAMTACGNTGEPAAEQESAPSDDAEVISNPTVSLGENLPTIELPGDYTMGDLPEELAKEGIYEIYVPVEDDNCALALYRFAKNGMTMQELIDYDIEKFVPDEQPVQSGEFDDWNEPGDYHYGYYAYYDDQSFDKPCYMQDYIFESGDDYVYAEFMTFANRISVGAGNAYIDVPASMSEVEIPEEDASMGCIKMFKDKYDDIPNIGIYVWDTEATTGEDLLTEMRETYDNDIEVLFEKTYNFEAVDGNTYEGCYVEFTETLNGEEYYECSSCHIVNGEVICYNISTPADDYEYYQIICPALLWSADVAAE